MKNKDIKIISGKTGEGRTFSIKKLEELYNSKKTNKKEILFNNPIEFEIKK